MPHSYSIALIFLAAGCTQGLSGFGSALVAMAVLLLFLDAKIAVPLCMINGLVITLYLSLQLRRHVDTGGKSSLWRLAAYLAFL